MYGSGPDKKAMLWRADCCCQWLSAVVTVDLITLDRPHPAGPVLELSTDLREVSQRLAKAHGRGGQGKHLQTTSRIQSKNRRVPKNSNNELSKYWRMFLNSDAFKASKAQNAGHMLPQVNKNKSKKPNLSFQSIQIQVPCLDLALCLCWKRLLHL